MSDYSLGNQLYWNSDSGGAKLRKSKGVEGEEEGGEQ